MTNRWISRVTGQPLTESAAPAPVSPLRQVLGEAEDEAEEKPGKEEKAEPPEKEKPEVPPAPATDKPAEQEPKAAVDADIEGGAEASADSEVDSQAVRSLVSSWQSGSRMDVASQLMYTPVSYADFVKMLFRIGEPDGVELGGMLDELSEVQPSIDQPGGGEGGGYEGGGGGGTEGGGERALSGSADRVLSRIAQRREREVPAGEPAGETGPEFDTAP